MSVQDAACYTGLFSLVLPSLNGTEGQSERMNDDHHKLAVVTWRESWRFGLEFCFCFLSRLEIYTACFPKGPHTWTISTVCVCRSMPPDQFVKDWRRLNCASLLLGYWHICICGVKIRIQLFKKRGKSVCAFISEMNQMEMVTFPLTCFYTYLCEGTMGAITDVDIMYSNTSILWCWVKKKSYQWSEQTFSVPN